MAEQLEATETPEPEMALPVDPQSRKRDLPEEDEIEERRAKQVKVWLESPSVHVIGDCIMVFAEDKSVLNDTEMLCDTSIYDTAKDTQRHVPCDLIIDDFDSKQHNQQNIECQSK